MSSLPLSDGGEAIIESKRGAHLNMHTILYIYLQYLQRPVKDAWEPWLDTVGEQACTGRNALGQQIKQTKAIRTKTVKSSTLQEFNTTDVLDKHNGAATLTKSLRSYILRLEKS